MDCGEQREGYRAYFNPHLFPPIAPLVYRDNSDGTFTEVAGKMGLVTPGRALGVALAGFDRDGHMDLAIANDSMPEFLYRNQGNDTFKEMGFAAEIALDSDGRTYAGISIDFEDFDNDVLPDLVITNLASQRYALYRNNGDSSFTYDTYVAGRVPITLLHRLGHSLPLL